MGRRVNAVDVELVEVALDDGLAGRVGDAMGETARRKAGADGKDNVALFQELSGVVAADADKEGMVLGESALGLQGGDYRRVGQLGQLLQLGGGLGVDDTLAGIDQGVLGVEQQVDGGIDVVGVGTGLVGLGREVGVGGLVVGGGGVGDGQHHGTGASAAQHGEGAAHELGDALGAVDVAEPLGYGPQAGGDVELGVLRAAGRDAVGDAQHGRVVLEGLGEAGVGVLQAGAVDAALDGADADALAGGDAGIGVGQRHGIAVVAHHDHGDALTAQGVVHAAYGEGGNPLDALQFQDAGNGGCYVDAHSKSSWWDGIWGIVTLSGFGFA